MYDPARALQRTGNREPKESAFMAKPTSRTDGTRSSRSAGNADRKGLMATVKKVAKFLSRPKVSGATAKPGAKTKAAATKVKAAVSKVAKKVTTKSPTAAAKSSAKAKPAAKGRAVKAPPAKAPAAKAPATKAPAAKAPATKAPASKAAAERASTIKASAIKASAARAAKPAAAPVPVPVPVPVLAAKIKGKVGKKGPAKKPPVRMLEPREEPVVPVQAPAARPRASKLPPAGEPLTKRSMEQVLTAGAGRGVFGEGSVKGKLTVKDGFPYLHVVGRDKRELVFLLQGPDQEVLPAYADHKVSVSGLVRKTTNYGGTVDVRKWAAKKLETEAAPAEPEQKLRFLSPGETEQLCTGGMGAGLIGFARLRGNLEMTGEEYFLVVSGAGTRQQVSFILSGKNTRSLRKHVGHTLEITGVAEKSSGWGGKLSLESFEVRPTEIRITSRSSMPMAHVEGLTDDPKLVDVVLNGGLTVRLPERAGFIWAIEPTSAKRIGLREANFEPANQGPGTREFFFTPRNPGTFDVDFFLAKAFNPGQVSRTCRLTVNVKQQHQA
jgi:hypothetical protein